MSKRILTPSSYVPVLKGREGEYGALKTLAPAVKSQLRPLIEIPPIPWDYAEDEPLKSIDDHISTVLPKVGRSWGSNPVWLDLLWIPDEERLVDGTHPLQAIFEVGRSAAVRLVPVTGLLRDEEYQKAVKDAVHKDQRGLVLRTQLPDFEDPAAGYDAIDVLLDQIGCTPEHADFVLDLGPLTEAGASAMLVASMAVLQSLRHDARWRTLSLVAGSFPANLTGLAPDDVSSVPRVEWQLWRALVRRAGGLPRLPIFGDYGVAHPEPSEVDPRIMRPSASVRYTTEESWIVPKGRNLRAHGFDQFHDVADALIQMSEYSGRSFSWGDDYIWRCAHRQTGPGNLTTWRKVGTSHHLTFVARQLATSSAASDAA